MADTSYSDESFVLKVQEEITQYLISEAISRVTGRGRQEVRGNKPGATFYAGNIFPVSELELSIKEGNRGYGDTGNDDLADLRVRSKHLDETEDESALYRLATR